MANNLDYVKAIENIRSKIPEHDKHEGKVDLEIIEVYTWGVCGSIVGGYYNDDGEYLGTYVKEANREYDNTCINTRKIYRECESVPLIVGYKFRNNEKSSITYLKADYTNAGIKYTKAVVGSGEEFIATRHELFGIALLNGDRINGGKIVFRKPKKRKEYLPYIMCGKQKSTKIRDHSKMINVSKFDGYKFCVKEEYRDYFKWAELSKYMHPVYN